MSISNLAMVALAIFAGSVSAHDSEFRGVYTRGAEVEVFSPCDSDYSYWTSYNWAGIPLREFHIQNAREPYQGVYVRFRGQLLDEETDGFAEGYDGLVRISEVYEMKVAIPADCGGKS